VQSCRGTSSILAKTGFEGVRRQGVAQSSYWGLRISPLQKLNQLILCQLTPTIPFIRSPQIVQCLRSDQLVFACVAKILRSFGALTFPPFIYSLIRKGAVPRLARSHFFPYPEDERTHGAALPHLARCWGRCCGRFRQPLRLPALEDVNAAGVDQVGCDGEVEAASCRACLFDDAHAAREVRLALLGLDGDVSCNDDYGCHRQTLRD
jgi:hypothetical protein